MTDDRSTSGGKIEQSVSGKPGSGKGSGPAGDDTNADDRVQSLEELEEIRMKKTTGIAGNMFKAPSPALMIGSIIALSFLVGYLTFFDLSHFGSNFTFESIFSTGIIFGIIVIALPAIVTGIIITPVVKGLGGIFYTRRALLMSFASVIMISVILMLSKLATLVFNIDFFLALSLGYAWVLAFHLSILMALSNNKYSRSLPPAFIHPALGIIMIYATSGMVVADHSFDMTGILMMFAFFIIFIIMTVIWIYVVTVPLKKEFGINGLSLSREGFHHFTEGEGKGMEVENFFESFGEVTTVSTGVIAVKRKNDKSRPTENGKRTNYKAVIVVPDIHKGPFGYLAGSNMPTKLGAELASLSEHILMPHGTATHDFNPVSTAETLRLGRAVKSSLSELQPEQFSSAVSKFVRTDGKPGVNISLQYIGDSPVGIFSAAPEPTDDIDPRVGKLARKTMTEANSGCGDNLACTPVFIDGHNSMKAGRGYVHHNSDQSRQIMGSLKKAVVKAKAGKTPGGLQIGFAQKTGYNKDKEGLGPMGIQVMVVAGAGGAKTAYILFDGNNLQRGLLKKIREHIRQTGLVDEVEAMTTDNHIVNMTLGGYSPVGERIDRSRLFSDLESVIRSAASDLEPVEVASTRATLDNFKIFGKGNTLRLSTTLNKTMALIGKSFVVCYGTASGLSVALMAFVLL